MLMVNIFGPFHANISCRNWFLRSISINWKLNEMFEFCESILKTIQIPVKISSYPYFCVAFMRSSSFCRSIEWNPFQLRAIKWMNPSTSSNQFKQENRFKSIENSCTAHWKTSKFNELRHHIIYNPIKFIVTNVSRIWMKKIEIERNEDKKKPHRNALFPSCFLLLLLLE